MSTKNKTITLRLTENDFNRLNEVCTAYGISRTEFVTLSIVAEWDKLHGNVELLKALEDLNALRDSLQSISSSLIPASSEQS